MSGTSLDGIDVAIADIDLEQGRKRIATLATFHAPYSAEVRSALLGVSNCDTHTAEIARLHFLLPELYAEAFHACVASAGEVGQSVELIGSHGQTIFHEGDPTAYIGRRVASTLQLGDGSVLAERAGLPVVSDFRPRDMAAGGKGAPLVPFVDYLLLADQKLGRVALNIGGIANITVMHAGCTPDKVVAFDTGPGNMVIDALVSHFTGGQSCCDRDGALALEGTVDPATLEDLLHDRYYSQHPPKTAGREQYGPDFLWKVLHRGLSPADAAATATALTAATIAEGIYRFGGGEKDIDQVIVSGGGVHNPALMRYLRAELADMDVLSSAELGIHPDFKEAIAFAVLAYETWHARPSNLPSATGAKHHAVLGKLSR
jgi:anhydro-N-acetylmuramic acid kinase